MRILIAPIALPICGQRISRGDSALRWRIYNLHALTLGCSESYRVGPYSGLPTSGQAIGTIGLGYTLLEQSSRG
jgi:hypothetical protein